MMRLKRVNILFGLCLIAWTFIVYVLLMTTRTPAQNTNNSSTVDVEGLAAFERAIHDELKRNHDLINGANEFLVKARLKQMANTVGQSETEKSSGLTTVDTQIPVLVFSYNRIHVSRCLDSLLKSRSPYENVFPIVVSQDGNHTDTVNTIKQYLPQIDIMYQPDQSTIPVPPRSRRFLGYYKIARHYRWALNQIFFVRNFTSAIIVEDDLEVASDFFEYFLATSPLLRKDRSLWCISAWNDNGKPSLVNPNGHDLLYRTDFFPGLGWMLTKDVWMELFERWPDSYWDDWMRQPQQRKNRSCIRPELSRTHIFEKAGVSNGMYYEDHLKHITLNDKFVPFRQRNLTYLLPHIYDRHLVQAVNQAFVVNASPLKLGQLKGTAVRIIYRTARGFKSIAKKLGLMDDFRSGVPRTAYRGIVSFFYNKTVVHLTPDNTWSGYDISWH